MNAMLWWKGWRDTRLAFLLLCAVFLVLAVLGRPWAGAGSSARADWLLKSGDLSAAMMEMLRGARGLFWAGWFGPRMVLLWPFYAALLGSAIAHSSCTANRGSGGAGYFTLSLPVTRRALLGVFAALGALQALALALAPTLLVAFLLRSADASFPVGEAIVYALILAGGGSAFFSLGVLFAVIFNHQVKAMVAAFAVILLFWPFRFAVEYPWWHPYHVLSAETYFWEGRVPWAGLAICFALSALMLAAAARIFERRDF